MSPELRRYYEAKEKYHHAWLDYDEVKATRTAYVAACKALDLDITGPAYAEINDKLRKAYDASQTAAAAQIDAWNEVGEDEQHRVSWGPAQA